MCWSANINGLDLDKLMKLYDYTLTTFLDKHSPARRVHMKISMLTLWFDGGCRAKRRFSKMLNQRYHHTKMDADQAAWISSMQYMHKLNHEKEQAILYYSKNTY